MKLFIAASRYSKELKLFIIITLAYGMAASIIDATFNNFLDKRFALSGLERSILEFPRELPGFLVVFVSALLWFLCSRRLGSVSMIIASIGALLIGFVSYTYSIMLLWLFLLSLGQHVMMPLFYTIGMELAEEGKTGQRLGQLNAIRNLAAIVGSFLVFLGFKYLGFTFQHTFLLATISFAVAALFLFSMKPEKTQPPSLHLKFRKEYKLYYILSILFGSRKQIFLTFAPWVLVTIFKQPTQTIATLLTLGGIIGILFQPLLGWATDHLGERFILLAESVLLVFVCFGYGFAKFILPEAFAFYIVCASFLLDQMLMAVNMARSMYMKKIAIKPSDIQSALTMSVTLDHLFSISIALIGGVIWSQFGFQYVFLMGTFIALGNFFAALRIKLPIPNSKLSQNKND